MELFKKKKNIYLEKIKENGNQNGLTLDFFGYLSHLKYILQIEKCICIHKIQILSLTTLILYMIIYKIWKNPL